VSPKTEAQLSQAQYVEIYDRLIKIFQERPREDWKRLVVFSKQWPQHKQGVFDRCVSGGGRAVVAVACFIHRCAVWLWVGPSLWLLAAAAGQML
jgi:hypothetical protein